MEREYRVIGCSDCIWRDYYRSNQSYPPRCPSCGAANESHYFIRVHFHPRVRALLGRDLGERVAFGEPASVYKRERDRRMSSSLHGYQQREYA
jgi:hypothetical protein